MLFIILKISQGRFMCLVMLSRPRSTDEYPVLWKIHYRCILQKEVSQSSSSPTFCDPFCSILKENIQNIELASSPNRVPFPPEANWVLSIWRKWCPVTSPGNSQHSANSVVAPYTTCILVYKYSLLEGWMARHSWHPVHSVCSQSARWEWFPTRANLQTIPGVA